MEDRRFVRLLKRLGEESGCTRYCQPSGGELLIAPIFRLVHNGVSFSRQADVDMYLLGKDDDWFVGTMSRWLQAHHAGDQSQPFQFTDDNGMVIVIPEALDGYRIGTEEDRA